MTMCNRHWLASLIALFVSATANSQEVSEAIQTANAFVGLGAKTVRIDQGRLAYIDLRGSTYTDANARLFLQTPDLIYLSLNGCPAGDNTLASLSNTRLVWLILDGTQVTNAGLKHLPGLQIRALSLAETGVTHSGVASIVKLPTLRRLSLASTKVSVEGLAQLGKLPNLSDLDISGIDVEKETFAALSSCKHLERLRVSGASVSIDNVAELSRLTNLKTLELAPPETTAGVRVQLAKLIPDVELIEGRARGKDKQDVEPDRVTATPRSGRSI